MRTSGGALSGFATALPIAMRLLCVCCRSEELTNKLSEEFKSTHRQIPWRAIRGMRNVVAHEYGKIDVETVWETAENGTRELMEFCQQELTNEPEITMGM